MSLKAMMCKCAVFLVLISASVTAWSADEPLFSVKQVSGDSDGNTFLTSGGTMRIEFCGDNVVHVVASRTADIPVAKVPVAVHQCHANALQKETGKEAITLSSAAITVRVNLASGAIMFLSKDGKTMLAEPQAGGKSFDVASVWEPKQWQVQQTFLSPSDESLYGLGQHQEGLWDLRGVPLRLHQSNTNISIPFLLSSKGYGILWNNPSLTDFNPADQVIQLNPATGTGKFNTGAKGLYGFLVSSDNRDQLTVEVDGRQIVDLHNMWTPTSASGAIALEGNTEHDVTARGGPAGVQLAVRTPEETTTFRSEVGQAIDYYYFYGPDLNRIISEYRELTGQAPLFPKWAYGYWQCRERYHNQKEILDTAAEFRTRKIPVDVLVQDWQYWGKYGWNALRFDEGAYPDPSAMMAELHRQNLHMVISVWAKFGAETAMNREMEDAHLVLTSAATTAEPGEAKERENWADLFNPKAQRAFWSNIDRNLFADGLDGWWLDASEPEGDPLKTDQTFLGPGKDVRNAYPLFETSAVYQGQRATTETKRVVILSRSAYTGQQRNGSISWSGDISSNWETLRRQIPAGLSFSMSGFPYWTTDIGGFFRPADQYTSTDYHELLIRWFQFGAFCPIFRIHGFRSETEMWKYGPEVQKILSQYDELRYRLLPYIYSAAWGVTSRGEILMKALPFVYPGDASLKNISDQFLFGDSLLVNPVTESHVVKRKVVLPAGVGWVDFWTGQTYPGGQSIVASAPLDRIPIFVRQGSIVPLGPLVQSASEAAEPLDLRVYAGKDADYLFYEDAGDGYGYERGARTTIHIRWDDRHQILSIGDRSGTFPGMNAERTIRIVVVAPGRGVGTRSESGIDRTVKYDGHQVAIRLGKAT